MHTVEVRKEEKPLENELVGLALEKLLNEESKLRFKFVKHPSPRDLQGGIYGLDTYVFEVEGQGTIVYEKFVTLGKFFANIYLLGFDKSSAIYEKLQFKLSHIVGGKADLPTYLEKGEMIETL